MTTVLLREMSETLCRNEYTTRNVPCITPATSHSNAVDFPRYSEWVPNMRVNSAKKTIGQRRLSTLLPKRMYLTTMRRANPWKWRNIREVATVQVSIGHITMLSTISAEYLSAKFLVPSIFPKSRAG